MGQQPSQPEGEAGAGEAAAAEAEGEGTSETGTAQGDAGASAGDAGAAGEQAAAETEAKAEPTEEEKAKAVADEAALKTAAEKYAKEQLAAANKTMAAARRAERAAKEAAAPLATEVATLKQQVGVYEGFVGQLQKEPMAALRRLGFASFRDFAQHVADNGGERAQTEEEKLDALVNKKLEEREAPRKKADQERAIEESKTLVFAHVDSLPDRYDLVSTDLGHEKLWKGIESYHKKHGVVPDAAVELIADEVEKEMTAGLSKSKKFGQRQPAKNGETASGAAAAGASTSGKTLAGKPTSGASTARKYSLDPDERTAQINEELRREGLL